MHPPLTRTARSRLRPGTLAAAGALVTGPIFLWAMYMAPRWSVDLWLVGAAGMLPFALIGWGFPKGPSALVAVAGSVAVNVATRLGANAAGVDTLGPSSQILGLATLFGTAALASIGRQYGIERAQALARLEEMLRCETALAESAAALLRDDPNEGLRTAIRAVHQATGVRLAYVGRQTDGLLTGFVLDGSRTTDIDPVALWRSVDGWRPVVSGAHPVTRDVMAGSELAAPVVAADADPGLVGLVAAPGRTWSATEEQTIRALAELIAAAWTRERTAERLTGLLHSKDRFLASVSHELRTPLAVVYGLASDIRDHFADFDPDELHELLALTAQQAEEVSQLVEDLLVFGRAEESQLTVVVEEVAVADSIAAVAAGLPTEVLSKLSIDTDCAAAAMVDPLRLRQVIRNLIMNAHRHGGPNISVSAGVTDGAVLIEVADDGAGVPEGHEDAIFEPYQSAHHDPGRTGSIGLGLTVSRQLTRLMGGELSYRREADRTVFAVSLPRSEDVLLAG